MEKAQGESEETSSRNIRTHQKRCIYWTFGGGGARGRLVSIKYKSTGSCHSRTRAKPEYLRQKRHTWRG